MVQQESSTVADIRRITGAQGQGKTCSSVALVVDDCYSKLTGIINPITGEYYKAKPLNDNEIKILESKGTMYSPLKHIRVFDANGKTSKITSKPRGWVIDSPVKVFCNFTLYGIRYMYIDDKTIIENVNTDTLTDGWIILDESILTDKRDTMSAVGKVIAWFGAQTRRRHLHMIVIAQLANMLQTRFNLFSTTTADCTYDEYTHMISLKVNGASPFMVSADYYAPDYWKFYKHDELVKVPEHRINKVMSDITKQEAR